MPRKVAPPSPDARAQQLLERLAAQVVHADRALLATAAGVHARVGEWARLEPETLSTALASHAVAPGETCPGGLSLTPSSDPRLAEVLRRSALPVGSAIWAHVARAGETPTLLYFDRREGGASRRFAQRDLDLLVGLEPVLAHALANAATRPATEDPAARLGLVTRNKRMQRLLRQIERVSRNAPAILLQGEPGVGKGLLARWIHELRAAPGLPFVSRHHDETDASALEALQRGATVFVEEIDRANAATQEVLWRALPRREDAAASAGRLVCGASAALHERVAAGSFREDLFQRLATHAFVILPLRERKDDIGPLALHFLKELAGEGEATRRRLAPEAVELLARHDWPGNVRSLMEEIERAVLVTEAGSVIGINAFSEAVRGSAGGGTTVKDSELPGGPIRPLAEAIAETERALIRKTLAYHEGNKSKTARTLGLTRRGLDLKLKRLGL